jgi:hypothetical protein
MRLTDAISARTEVAPSRFDHRVQRFINPSMTFTYSPETFYISARRKLASIAEFDSIPILPTKALIFFNCFDYCGEIHHSHFSDQLPSAVQVR